MGASSSKTDGNKALLLCKERMRFIKQAVDLRYALSAAQLCYTQSLRNVGAALGQFAEAEILLDPTRSTFEPEQTPSRSSYASPSPSHFAELHCSPSHDGGRLSNASYMRAAGSASVKVTINSSSNHCVEEEGEDALTFPVPPPPPFPDIGYSWDFFDPVNAVDSIKIPNGENAMRQHFGKYASLRQNESSTEEPNRWKVLTQDNFHSMGECDSSAYSESSNDKSDGSKMVGHSYSINNSSLGRSLESVQTKEYNVRRMQPECSGVNGSTEAIATTALPELCRSNTEKTEDKRIDAGREDASKLINYKAKDFLSSIKDIEHRFIRASESGHEVSRMLETKKIRLSIHSEIIGGKTSDSFLSILHFSCCKAENLSEGDAIHNVTKVIIWNRSISSRSSSSRNPVTPASKDNGAESHSDFIEEFSMISGSHSSSLDRLYAWERKLYDELKASESIRKAYDLKCSQLRRQFAKDMNARVIDKTRAAAKDLHSRVRVTIQAVDSISRRIEKLRDEELQPQLAELIQGLIRMWRAMLECHQAQHTIISLAYHVKNSAAPSQEGDSYKQAVMNLRNEMECFRSSFASWVDAQKSYIGALNGWIQKCILQPQERSRGRKVPFSPRRALAPPIFVLCRDWLAGIHPLPLEEACGSIKGLITTVSELLEHQKEGKQEDGPLQVGQGEENKQNKEEERCVVNPTSLVRLQASMISTFECLVKFSEESVKVYESVKLESQAARDAYVSSGWFKV